MCIQNRSDNRMYYRMSGGSKDHRFTVQEPWFSHIKSGKKTVEGRLKRGRFEHIGNGDKITWVNRETNEEVHTEVTKHDTYKNVDAMIDKVGAKTLLPGVKTKEEAKEVYDKFYSKERQDKHEAIALHLKVIDN